MTVNEVFDVIQSILTSAAIIGGAIWFFQRRQREQRALIGHSSTYWPVTAGAVNKKVLRTVVVIENEGEVLLTINEWYAFICQVNPLPADIAKAIEQGIDPSRTSRTEIAWDPLIAWEFIEDPYLELEPGERYEIPCDFVLDTNVETITIYTFFRNAKRTDAKVGWDKTSLFELKEKEAHHHDHYHTS